MKRKKKPSKASIRRKAFSAWSIAVRERDGACVLCGRTDHLQAHHVISRRYAPTAFSMNNGVSVCPKCHKFSPKSSFHSNPLSTMEWFRVNRPEQYAKLTEESK